MSTSVYLLRLDFLTDRRVYEEMRERASLARRLRADKYRLFEDRIRSLGAGLLLEYATGLSDEDMEYEPNGKPFFPAYPETAFSLSHSGMIAALAVSSRRCGIDVEEIRAEKESFRLITEKYFTEEERTRVYQHGFDPSAFSGIWTRKEAYVKMTGSGIMGLRKTGKAPCFFPVLEAPQGYALSLCMEGEETEEAALRFVTPEELRKETGCLQ